MKQRTRKKLERKLHHQEQQIAITSNTVKNQQMVLAETPLFKDVCPSCGSSGADCPDCTCRRWDWYGAEEEFEQDV